MGVFFSYYKTTLATAVAISLTIYNRYQAAKYNLGVLKRKKEKRDRETPLTKELYPYQLQIGAPSTTLIHGGPDTPLLAFTDSLGFEIAAYFWPATNGNKDGPCLLLCHGLDVNAESEFCIRPGHHWEGSWQKHLCDAGFNVYGWDHHAMGRSESIMQSNHRTVCYDFEDYTDVTLQMTSIVKRRHAHSKIFLHGQSLGGCVAVRAVERRPELFAGLSLACPAVYLEKLKKKPINKILLPLVDILGVVVPWLPLAEKQPHPRPDISEESDRIGSPMFQGNRKIPASMAAVTIPAADRAIADTLRMKDVPIHMMHAPEDPFVDYRGSEIMYNMLTKAGAKDVTMYNTFEDPEHDIVQLKDSQKCAGILVNWLLERV